MNMERILIVDDDITFGLMLKTWLSKKGFGTQTAASAAAARTALAEGGFSLVLSDMRLPDEDGIALLQWMSGQRIEVPVIVMTSYAEIQNAVRCIVVTGAGEKSFVAGADIAAMSVMTKAEGEAFGKMGNDIFRSIETFPIPVIAAVNGFALGGGNELAMSCDIRICSENAMFGQPEVGLGITPGFGGTQRLARLVGAGMAKELVYAAVNIGAEEALRIGLVNHVYPQAELMEQAMKLANKIARNAPIAVQACKKAINEGLEVTTEEGEAIEEKLFGSCFETHDQKEGMGCFLSREKPKPKAVFTNN